MESLPQLALLGLLSGVVTGIVILGFRLAIEWPLARFLPGHDPEAFEQLGLLTRGLLPLLGACALGVVSRADIKSYYQYGPSPPAARPRP